MIVSGLLGLFFDVFSDLLSGLNMAGLPADTINVLSDILMYGVWIIGPDLFAIFLSCVTGWWGVKFGVGLVLWVWELLPLT